MNRPIKVAGVGLAIGAAVYLILMAVPDGLMGVTNAKKMEAAGIETNVRLALTHLQPARMRANCGGPQGEDWRVWPGQSEPYEYVAIYGSVEGRIALRFLREHVERPRPTDTWTLMSATWDRGQWDIASPPENLRQLRAALPCLLA